ncbi:hypothetical protein ANN_24371 [Periplaneta americana]|uniref:K Homology domain-containing protein n=1 Tax=Periplaneta americana TaxID=6978 RepID=A0ABQ8S2Y7_PERAM|nr:hypothetical protein ANN_24371 [Periplaneta americana]
MVCPQMDLQGALTSSLSRQRSTSGFIIDPTVRMETYENQPTEAHQEKCDIYDPTIPYYKEKYHLTSIEVIGLLIGARGTITKRFAHFCKQFGLGQTLVTEVPLSAVKGSIKILRNHLYTTWRVSSLASLRAQGDLVTVDRSMRQEEKRDSREQSRDGELDEFQVQQLFANMKRKKAKPCTGVENTSNQYTESVELFFNIFPTGTEKFVIPGDQQRDADGCHTLVPIPGGRLPRSAAHRSDYYRGGIGDYE